MLKIIELNSSVTEEIIAKYSQNSNEVIFMQLENDKYTIDSINEYINCFSYSREYDDTIVGIILNGHKLSDYQQNKLLKTFEESKDNHIHLIFIANKNLLLDTILSRAIVLNEQNQFEYKHSKLHDFAKEIITTSEAYSLLLAEDEIFRQLYKIKNNLEANNIELAIVSCSQIKFDKVKYSLFNKLIQNYLYQRKRTSILKYLFEVELRTKYQVNLDLQALLVLIQIKNNKEYYERSSWS